MSEGSSRRIQFGPYEADLTAGQLTKNGRPVRLQEQPFQVLATLLQRPGEVVSRDELRERLWPGESFGDFDQGLNTAINKLREALGDSASNPRFIETLPKRGYRFTFPIESEPPPPPNTAPGPWRPALSSRVAWAIAAVSGLIALIVVLVWTLRPAAAPQLPLRKFNLRLPLSNYTTPDAQVVAVSPNGKHVAIITTKLWIQDLDQQEPREVKGSDGARAPFWSPDSAILAFAVDGKLNKVPVSGEPISVICESPAEKYITGGSWSPDSQAIAFTAGSPSALYMVTAGGGSPKLLFSPESLEEKRGELLPARGTPAGWVSQPQFLPASGAPRILFTYFAEIPYVLVHDLNRGWFRNLGPGSDPAYSPTGHLLYRSENDLWARRYSLKEARLSGEAFQVARTAAEPSLASDGTLVYRDAVPEQLVWFHRSGSRIGTVGQPSDGIYYPVLSPDGRRVAAEVLENGNQDIWVSEIDRGSRIRVTSHHSLEVLPVWAPAGDEVAYSSYRAGNIDLFVRSADAGSPEKKLNSLPQNERVADWSKDGQYILYTLMHPKTGQDLWYLKRSTEGEWESHPLLTTPFNENSPKLSPDGRYVAYLSNESGRDELYVRPFPGGGRTWPVSARGASQIRWSRDSGELFYVEAGTLVAVGVRTQPEFTAGQTTRLFSHAAFRTWADPNYDVSADGKRIILPERVGGREPKIHVVQNWFSEFRGPER